MPSQFDGLRFGLRRGGRCLIADEMGLGKTLQAIAIAIFGHQNDPAKLTRLPRVVVTSYTMLSRLQKSMLEINWAVLIVDESHHVRCSKKKVEAGETKATLDMATKAWLVGEDKDSQGKSYRDFSQGCRLQELSILLRQTVMIRRLKENLLVQLPPKRRQIIRLALKKSDIILAKEAIAKHDTGIGDGKQDKPSDISDTADDHLLVFIMGSAS
ncbi:hypothetical protein V2J09_014910 [Rumex salicifolius]